MTAMSWTLDLDGVMLPGRQRRGVADSCLVPIEIGGGRGLTPLASGVMVVPVAALIVPRPVASRDAARDPSRKKCLGSEKHD